MKRADLLAKLEGVANAQEIVDFVMSENGKDIESAKVDTSSFEQKISELQASVKAYEQGGDKYIDPSEYARLVKAEEETKTREQLNNTKNAVKQWLKDNNASDKALELLIKAVDLNAVEIKEGKIANPDVLGSLKTEYKDFFVEVEQGGATPSNPPAPQAVASSEPKTLAEAVKQKYEQ